MVVLLCPLASSVAAQGRPPAPQRGPEHQRLGYFVGNWQTEGEVKPGPFSTGGRFISTDRVEWLDGRFFVVERATSTLPAGNQIQLSLIGWDARQKVYTFDSFNSAGIRTSATGVIVGDTWTWSTSDTFGTLRIRHVITMVSPSTFTFTFQTSVDGVTWSPFIEGRSTKVQ